MTSIHDRTAELIPWYVTGRLPAREHAEIETHLNECLPCRALLREEENLHGLVRGQEDIPLSPQHGMSDLLTRIAGEDRCRTAWMVKPRLAYGLAAVLAIAVGGTVLSLLTRPAGTPDPGSFSTLTDAAGPGAGRIDVLFAEAMNPQEIEAFIDTLGAQILGGPSELGRYTLAVPVSTPTSLDRLLDELAANPNVRFAGRNFIDEADPDAAEQR